MIAILQFIANSMEYLSIKQLSAKFAMPERTVYYNIANNPNIRVRKQWRSKFANVADFAKACGKELQTLPDVAETPKQDTAKSESRIDIAILQKSLQTLQQENKVEKDRMLSLQQVNNNLQTNLNRFVQLHSDEKKEKTELMEKYDNLQKQYHLEIQHFLKKYYLILGLCFVLIVIMVILNFIEIAESVQKIVG